MLPKFTFLREQKSISFVYSKETEKKLGTYPKWEHLEKQKKNSLKNCELGVVVKMPVFHVRNDWICVWLHF